MHRRAGRPLARQEHGGLQLEGCRSGGGQTAPPQPARLRQVWWALGCYSAALLLHHRGRQGRQSLASNWVVVGVRAARRATVQLQGRHHHRSFVWRCGGSTEVRVDPLLPSIRADMRVLHCLHHAMRPPTSWCLCAILAAAWQNEAGLCRICSDSHGVVTVSPAGRLSLHPGQEIAVFPRTPPSLCLRLPLCPVTIPM